MEPDYNTFIMKEKKSTLEYAVNAIRDYILQNKLKSGDPMPGETELAATLGISRNILREALRHYRTLGILKSRTKTGSYIASLVPESPFSGYLPFLAASTDILPKLVEIRVLLEVGAAPLITANITKDQINILAELCRRRETCDDDTEKLELDCQFHTQMLKGANNPILDSMIPLIIDFFFDYKSRSQSIHTVKSRTASNRDHRAILNAVKKRDTAALAEALSKHNQIYFEIFAKGEEH